MQKFYETGQIREVMLPLKAKSKTLPLLMKIQRSRKEESTNRDDEDKANHGLTRTTSNQHLMDQGSQQKQTKPNRSPVTLGDQQMAELVKPMKGNEQVQ